MMPWFVYLGYTGSDLVVAVVNNENHYHPSQPTRYIRKTVLS
jgi:hypothetical protein